MSLKGFHILFIIFSTALALGCGMWCLQLYFVEQASSYLVGVAASFLAAIALFVYGVYFYRKMKRLRIYT